jgi:hypothetical protein
MKKLIVAMFALVLLDSLAVPQTTPPVEEPTPSCPTEPPPLPTHTELDPNPARYAGFGLPGEELTPWEENDPDYVLTDKGAQITYHDQGQLYTHECPAGSRNAYWFEEDQWVKDPVKCWIRKPVKTSGCT